MCCGMVQLLTGMVPMFRLHNEPWYVLVCVDSRIAFNERTRDGKSEIPEKNVRCVGQEFYPTRSVGDSVSSGSQKPTQQRLDVTVNAQADTVDVQDGLISPGRACGQTLLVKGRHEADGTGMGEVSNELSPLLYKLALLHAAILKSSCRIHIMDEISFVFNLLAIDLHVNVPRKEYALDQSLLAKEELVTGTQVIRYALIVILNSGGLIRGLDVKSLGEISAYVHELVDRMQQQYGADSLGHCLEQLKDKISYILDAKTSSENFDFIVKASQETGSLSGHLGLNVFVNDQAKAREPEDQKKLSNRESFRDSWFSLMKDAVTKATSLRAETSPRDSNGNFPPSLAEEMEGEAAALKILQDQANPLLRRLRRDNFNSFAELFTAAVLQAAATGEALMDEELTGLAKRNLNKFHSLNKRLQGRSGPSGITVGKRNSEVAQHVNSGKQWKHHSSSAKRYQAADFATKHALDISLEFPKPLRPFVLFLEAADSHRLDISILQTMNAKIHSLLEVSYEESPQLGDGGVLNLDELVIATSTLASFIGYISFSKGSRITLESSEFLSSLRISARYDGSHPLDVLHALEMCFSVEWKSNFSTGSIFKSLPWISRYLRFLLWSEDGLTVPYFEKTFQLLESIRQQECLLPQSLSFTGSAALCLRSMIEDLISSVEEYYSLKLDPKITSPASVNLSDCLEKDLAWAERRIGNRYLELACPSLVHLRGIFGSKVRQSNPSIALTKSVKKIRPTAPRKPDSALILSQVPPVEDGGVGSLMADPWKDAHQSNMLLKLEQVFLDQYSSSDVVTDIKLREVVALCSDAIARQGIAAGIQEAFGSSYYEFVDKIKLEIEAFCVSMEGNIGQCPADTNVNRPFLRKAAIDIVDRHVPLFVHQAKKRSQDKLHEIVETCTRSTVKGLLPAQWGIQVHATAAAIIARRAESAGGKKLMEELFKLSRIKFREIGTSTVSSVFKQKKDNAVTL